MFPYFQFILTICYDQSMDVTAQKINIQQNANVGYRAIYVEDVLFSRGLLTPEQLTFVKSEAKRRQELKEKVLSQMGGVSPEQIVAAKANPSGIILFLSALAFF